MSKRNIQKWTFSLSKIFLCMGCIAVAILLVRSIVEPVVFDNGWSLVAGVFPAREGPETIVDCEQRYAYFDKDKNCVLIIEDPRYGRLGRRKKFAYLDNRWDSHVSGIKFIPATNCIAVLRDGQFKRYYFSRQEVSEFWQQAKNPKVGPVDLGKMLETHIEAGAAAVAKANPED